VPMATAARDVIVFKAIKFKTIGARYDSRLQGADGTIIGQCGEKTIMKRLVWTLGIVCTGAVVAIAQPPGGPRSGGGPGGPGGPGGGRGGDFHPPTSPVVEALDTDGDHVISSGEIQNAPTSLTKLDTNKDGKLTEDEFRPRPPGGGPGGQPGARGNNGNGNGSRGAGQRNPGGGRGPEGGPGGVEGRAADLTADPVAGRAGVDHRDQTMARLVRSGLSITPCSLMRTKTES
jgi:hypothetical protein